MNGKNIDYKQKYKELKVKLKSLIYVGLFRGQNVVHRGSMNSTGCPFNLSN